MITDQIIPAYVIRLYLWEILREAEALKIVNGKNPIIPLEDEPDLSDAGENYIIYTYSENAAVRLDEIRRGIFAARVIAKNSNDLDRIISITSRAFESSDIATEAINQFSTRFSNGELEGIRFTNIRTSHTEGYDASLSEEGPVEGIIVIDYSYINHLPIPVPESLSKDTTVDGGTARGFGMWNTKFIKD